MTDFQTWLDDRGIDCQELTPELQEALQAQFEQEQRNAPVASLVIPIDCSWPTRGYWNPIAQ